MRDNILWPSASRPWHSRYLHCVVVIVVVLLGLAVGLGALAVWLWRVTAVDSPSLMVLEQMSSRRYQDADEDERAVLRTSAIPVIADDAEIDDEVRSEE